MLDGFEDKYSEAHCVYALMPLFGARENKDEATTIKRMDEGSKKKIVFFRGIARGHIVSPRGELGWGWDPVFQEERSRLTFAEMEPSIKSEFSHRANAVKLLEKYLAK